MKSNENGSQSEIRARSLSMLNPWVCCWALNEWSNYLISPRPPSSYSSLPPPTPPSLLLLLPPSSTPPSLLYSSLPPLLLPPSSYSSLPPPTPPSLLLLLPPSSYSSLPPPTPSSLLYSSLPPLLLPPFSTPPSLLLLLPTSLQEYFNQSDREKVEGLPVTPFMDRDRVTRSSSQVGFIRFILLPLFESMSIVSEWVYIIVMIFS